MIDTTELFVELLKLSRLPLNSEAECKKYMADLMLLNHIDDFKAEYVLDQKSRLDFFFPSEGLAIEVKLKGGRMDTFRQCQRYCAYDEVKALILVTNRALFLPGEINGKKTYMVNLGRAWL